MPSRSQLTHILAGIAAGSLGFLSACQSPRAGLAALPDAGEAALSADGAAFAEAMARFSQGFIDQIHGDLDAALTNYLAAIALDPDNGELYLRVAMGYLRQKQPEQAVAVIRSLAERQPRNEQPHLWLGLVYRAIDQPADAEKAYRQAIKIAPAQPAAYFEIASMYVRQGKDDEAIALLETALDRAKNTSDLLRLLGELYIRKAGASAPPAEKKNRDAAIDALERAMQQDPGDITLLYQLGDLYIMDRQIEKAISYFEKIERLQPDNLQIKKKLALSFAASGDQAKAVEALEEIARREPANRYVYYYLGELYEKLGDKDKALLNYSLASKTAPAEPAPFLKLALLRMEKDPEAAATTLADGLAQLPGNIRLTEMLAYVYLSQKKYAEAVAQFEATERILAAKEDAAVTPFFYFNFAIAAQHADKMEKAAANMARAAEFNLAFLDTYIQYTFQQKDEAAVGKALRMLETIAPQFSEEPGIQVYIGLLHSYTKAYDKAVAAFEKAEKTAAASPGGTGLDASAYFWYAAACERLGQFDRAEKLFFKCIELKPEHAEAHNYIAYMWAEKGLHLDRALELVNKALSIEPESGAFLDTLGWIYYMQGRYPEALEQIRKAFERVPEDPTIADHLGDVLLKLGKEEEALAEWERSFLGDPDNENVAGKLRERGVDLDALRVKSRELKAARKAAAADSPEEEEAVLPLVPPIEEDDAPLVPAAGTNAPKPELAPRDEF